MTMGARSGALTLACEQQARPAGRAEAKRCVLRTQDLKKAFNAESVSCGFSSGRK
jgi:hypothetical protein